MQIIFTPIGTVYSPFKTLEEMPIQPAGAQGIKGTVSIKAQYLEGLADLDGFSHIYLLYHFHQAGTAKLRTIPFLDDRPRGIFATRAPLRPNAIGLSVVKLDGIIGNLLQIENVDILNGTPVLDIKPYIPEFDQQATVKIGWLEHFKGLVTSKKSDSRFS
jgi:tRNA (adenine37-N6)-methyltransferase